jgi:hypothetical protein
MDTDRYSWAVATVVVEFHGAVGPVFRDRMTDDRRLNMASRRLTLILKLCGGKRAKPNLKTDLKHFWVALSEKSSYLILF